ncbi:MAG: hypothetical protein ACJ8HI_12405 [Massilia sp.]
MADRLGRAGAAIAGAISSLLLSWSILLLARRFDHAGHASASAFASVSISCEELQHCGGSWQAWALLAAVLLLPAALMTILNFLAWRRWRWPRWCACALAISVVSGLLQLAALLR